MFSRLKELIGDVEDHVDDKKDPILTAIAGSAKNITKETDSGPIRDAGLIATAQKIEHYEIASYGSARDWAMQLGLRDHAATLQTTPRRGKACRSGVVANFTARQSRRFYRSSLSTPTKPVRFSSRKADRHHRMARDSPK